MRKFFEKIFGIDKIFGIEQEKIRQENLRKAYKDIIDRIRKERSKFLQKSPKMLEYYQLLGVTTKSTQDDIKKAYRQKAKQYHPDINHAIGAEEKFKKIQEAYNYLKRNHVQNTNRIRKSTSIKQYEFMGKLVLDNRKICSRDIHLSKEIASNGGYLFCMFNCGTEVKVHIPENSLGKRSKLSLPLKSGGVIILYLFA